ncbi:MAG: HD domain-containing protein [Betaproteobacteria bacterium]|jgi:phosphonate degradation associated HDIG domain protein|nr:HD domain-containing protein [Betaproteobacteria bacterium]
MTSSNLDKQHALDELTAIYDGRATGQYGLTLVNQRAHAVQSGHHARAQGLSAAVVVAALLHDIGHMVHELGEHPAALGIDDRHEDIGADWLKRYYGPDVTEPIRLHVAAKRYLCSAEPDYFAKLSEDSIESLELQGGYMTDAEASAFRQAPHWEAAVALRRIDELAKDPNGPMPRFDEFADEILQTLS